MSDWNKYDNLFKPDSDYNRLRDEAKHGESPAISKDVLDIKDEYFDDTPLEAKATLAAESGKFIDGLPWDKFFHAKNMGEKIVAAYRLYLFAKDKIQPLEVINIGGEDYNLKDYGLDNCFSIRCDILLPWLCIQKKITKQDLRFQLAWEDRIYG